MFRKYVIIPRNEFELLRSSCCEYIIDLWIWLDSFIKNFFWSNLKLLKILMLIFSKKRYQKENRRIFETHYFWDSFFMGIPSAMWLPLQWIQPAFVTIKETKADMLSKTLDPICVTIFYSLKHSFLERSNNQMPDWKKTQATKSLFACSNNLRFRRQYNFQTPSDIEILLLWKIDINHKSFY